MLHVIQLVLHQIYLYYKQTYIKYTHCCMLVNGKRLIYIYKINIYNTWIIALKNIIGLQCAIHFMLLATCTCSVFKYFYFYSCTQKTLPKWRNYELTRCLKKSINLLVCSELGHSSKGEGRNLKDLRVLTGELIVFMLSAISRLW